MSYPHVSAAARRAQKHLLLSFLKIARTATERALLTSRCPDVRHLVECAEDNLAAAHDLIRTDLEWAA